MNHSWRLGMDNQRDGADVWLCRRCGAHAYSRPDEADMVVAYSAEDDKVSYLSCDEFQVYQVMAS